MKRTIKLHLDPTDSLNFWSVTYTDGRRAIPLSLDAASLRKITKHHPGRPTDCIFTMRILEAAKENPKMFPHPCLFAYTLNSVVYIITKLGRDGRPSHAVRYRLQQPSAIVRLYDRTNAKAGPKAALEAVCTMLGDGPVSMSLGKGKTRRDGTPPGPARGNIGSRPGTRTHIMSTGVLRRAEEAHLI